MPVAFEQYPLVTYLQSKDAVYYGKVLELRQTVREWLNYIPHTFPHYTRHTLEHSEEIILQVSKLLFESDSPQSPVIPLSAIEAYIIIVSAFLHDAGMVTSDTEKERLLGSDEWRDWTTTGGGADRWQAAQQLRAGDQPHDDALRNFLADVQVRFLIAEFIRRRHHLRAAEAISQHHASFATFDFGNPVLRRTISNVCAAHGLRTYELEDAERFPDRCDLRGEQANIRFAALMLRLGDLLDMSQDRACPLLLNAASPLPADSLAHWTQYSAVTKRLTAPDEIVIHAECANQEEHRLLSDWCQWLVEELAEARTIMSRCQRHPGWRPPRAKMGDPGGTISIRPVEGATYIPVDWVFELDVEQIFARLVHDVYESPETFIRELIQNSLDATRSELYRTLAAEGAEIPDSPTRVSDERRRAYPIRIAISDVQRQNALSGELETRQLFTISDPGIGMDREIIRRYLLQVGRSYYTTDEFRRSFKFTPSSRFGIGFLSVFGASDEVIVETYKPASAAGDGPLRLVLTGPRNYLLVEHGHRTASGTKIEVLLNEAMEPGELTKVIGHWCRRVEFPIMVNDFGQEATIESERPEDFKYEMPDLSEEGATFAVRSFPVSGGSVEGEVYVFARTTKDGESWTSRGWVTSQYPSTHPQASVPPFPGPLLSANGIATHFHSALGSDSYSARIDYRGRAPLTLSREQIRNLRRRPYLGQPLSEALTTPVDATLKAALTDHLSSTAQAAGPTSWIYRQRLVAEFPTLTDFWRTFPGTIPVWRTGEQTTVTLEEMQTQEVFRSAVPTSSRYWPLDARPEDARRNRDFRGTVQRLSAESEVPVLLSEDIERISEAHRLALFGHVSVLRMEWYNELLVMEWAKSNPALISPGTSRPIILAEFPSDQHVGFRVHKTTDGIYGLCLLNLRHPLVQWLQQVRKAVMNRESPVEQRQVSQLVTLFYDPLSYSGHNLEALASYLAAWRSIDGLPEELCPPEIELNREMFTLHAPRS